MEEAIKTWKALVNKGTALQLSWNICIKPSRQARSVVYSRFNNSVFAVCHSWVLFTVMMHCGVSDFYTGEVCAYLNKSCMTLSWHVILFHFLSKLGYRTFYSCCHNNPQILQGWNCLWAGKCILKCLTLAFLQIACGSEHNLAIVGECILSLNSIMFII